MSVSGDAGRVTRLHHAKVLFGEVEGVNLVFI